MSVDAPIIPAWFGKRHFKKTQNANHSGHIEKPLDLALNIDANAAAARLFAPATSYRFIAQRAQRARHLQTKLICSPDLLQIHRQPDRSFAVPAKAPVADHPRSSHFDDFVRILSRTAPSKSVKNTVVKVKDQKRSEKYLY